MSALLLAADIGGTWVPANGRLSGLSAEVPLRVILDPKTTLHGAAARCAAEGLS